MKKTFRFGAAISLTALSMLICGCSSARSFESKVGMKSFPPNTGMNAGSYFYAPWIYVGSDAEYDRFIYSYSTGNIWSHLPFKIRKGVVSLSFPERFDPSEGKRIAVDPRTSGDEVVGFSTAPPRLFESVNF